MARLKLDDPRPPYLQVADDLRQRIASGELTPGAQVPSGKELAGEWGIAPMTAQNAVRVLRDEGLVVSQPGRGAFVHDTAPERLRQRASGGEPNVEHLAAAGIVDLWPRSAEPANADLLARIKNAESRITVFGLTRNFYAWDNVLPVFEAKAADMPVTFYSMDPRCASRKDRYRLEPLQATMEDPNRFIREVLQPLHAASERVTPTVEGAGLHLYTFNFPCSFGIEQIDEMIRVHLYGHGVRGTESPVFLLRPGTPFYDYFHAQIQWLRLLATDPPAQWKRKGIEVKPVVEADLDVPEVS